MILHHPKERADYILKRDKSCLICPNTMGLAVHHIVPRSHFGKKMKDLQDDERNLCMMCLDCHPKAHTHEMRAKCLAILIERYGYEYPEEKFRMYL